MLSQTPLDGQVPDEKFNSASFRAISLSSGEWVKRRGCRWGSRLHTYLPCPLNDCCDWCEYDIAFVKSKKLQIKQTLVIGGGDKIIILFVFIRI